jgi:hypothetical protein
MGRLRSRPQCCLWDVSHKKALTTAIGSHRFADTRSHCFDTLLGSEVLTAVVKKSSARSEVLKAVVKKSSVGSEVLTAVVKKSSVFCDVSLILSSLCAHFSRKS